MRNSAQRMARLLISALAISIVACGDDDGSGVEFFDPGGVSEEMRNERASARLNLDHTVVTLLEATGQDSPDTGAELGQDDFLYHFSDPIELRLQLGEFDDDAPTVVALDDAGNEIGRVSSESPEVSLTVSGEHRFRFVHPRAGDETAPPILIFFQPGVIEADAGDSAATLSGANSNDVATLKADKSCFRCNFKGLSWKACPSATLDGINLSHSDFTGAVLACQQFQSKGNTPTLLTATDFTNASLSEVLFKDVDLTDAVFFETFFDLTVFDGVTATSANFSDSKFMNSTFGASSGSGSSARDAYFTGTQIVENSCLSTYDLRGADFTNAMFDSSSSVHGTWFAGANLYGVTFDGTKFQHDSVLPDCGRASSCNTVTVDGLCENCPCTADLGCLELGGEMACPQNQGPWSLSTSSECQRPAAQSTPQGPVIDSANLLDVAFNGADLTNAVFSSNQMDSGNDFDGAILDGVDFTQQDLGKAVDLSGAYLTNTTDFTGATLTDAPATQRGVNLSCDANAGTGGCNFTGGTTSFTGADMQYAQLLDAGLSMVDLEGANLSNASLVGADLSFASLKGANLTGATLGSAQADGTAATLRGAFMINVDLTDTDLRSVDFTDAHLYGAQSDALFVRAKLDSANFTDAILTAAIFTNASMTAAVFNGAQLVNASFEGATLTNAKFDDAYLQGADFSTAASVTGISLSNAAVSTELTSTQCDLIPPGTWTYMEQDGTPYTYSFGATNLLTNSTVVCAGNVLGPFGCR